MLEFLPAKQPEIVSSSSFSCKQLKALGKHTGSFSRNEDMQFPRLLRGLLLPPLSHQK